MSTRSKSPGMLLRNAGLFNPVLVQAVGLCPVVAMATTLRGAALLALVAAVVIILSEVIASLFLKRVPRWVRIALYILLGGVLVLPFMTFFEKNQPELFSSLGLYLPIMAVNSLVVLRCERFAVKLKPFSALRDGLTASFGYAVVLLAVGLVREALANGSVGGFTFKQNNNFTGLLLPFGGFLIIGYFAAALRSVISAYWPKYLDKKQPKPRTGRKRPKRPVSVEREAFVPSPEETTFTLEEIEAVPFGAELPDGAEETEAADAVYVPVQPVEPRPVIETAVAPQPVTEPEPIGELTIEPAVAPQVGDVFTKTPPAFASRAAAQPSSTERRSGLLAGQAADSELEALFHRSLDEVLSGKKEGDDQ